MAQYTAKDLRNITKAELAELLTKEGIAFDPKMPFFAMKALLLNKGENESENENDETMGKKKNEPVVEKDNEAVEPIETVEPVETSEEVKEPENVETSEEVKESENVETPEDVKEPEAEKPEKKEQPQRNVNALAALRGELVRRKGRGLGNKSAFAAELAKRRGERVTGVTFAQELKSRQLKYGNK